MMYSAVLLLYAILKQRDGVPKTGKGAEGHGARERLLTIHLMELLRKNGKYATKLGLEPSIKVRVLAEKKGFIENLVVFYLENSGHKITLYTKRWFALANHFFLCYNIFRYFSIFGGFLLTLNQYLL